MTEPSAGNSAEQNDQNPSAEEPAEAEDLAGAEMPAAAEEPGEVEDPAEAVEPAAAEEPDAAEIPAEAEDHAEAEEPAEAEITAEVEEPAEAEDPAWAEMPAEAEIAAEVEEPAEAEKPAEQSIGARAPVKSLLKDRGGKVRAGIGAAAAVVLLGIAAALLALLGRPAVSVSSGEALVQVHLSGVGAAVTDVSATSAGRPVALSHQTTGYVPATALPQGETVQVRSEERRVGKECSS